MKKLILFFLIAGTTLQGQNVTPTYRHELKLNALNLVLGNPELNYEYLLNSNSGVGFYVNGNIDHNHIWPYTYMAGLNYRLYVGGKYASGFFFEGGVNAIGIEDYDGYKEAERINGWGPSFAIGGKFLIKNTIILEFFGGLGRNFNTHEDRYGYDNPVFPRWGVSVGKRF